ncbi:hypothetical protein [Devosia sp. MC521]|uniref:hypothetical protein n=1 Tax=Devosia sp. MC521 TaxID=2759954 RepID=UPI0015FB7D78|nr:hypothetical protein [Devosia sp. MC521]MBJ6986925.1 hypothetical protein [Devosia sp. MC521]QMW63949.1 hypothetical protein H4N61_06435 [Devosia sp. MC521]
MSQQNAKRIIAARLIQDPSMSDAEYYHQRQIKSGPNVGKVMVQFNLVEYIGGLARLEGVSELQIMAAAKYRNAYERAQIGGARAVDYEAVKVDTSGPREDVLTLSVADALETYRRAAQFLGLTRSSHIERVVCHDQPLTSRGMGARERSRAKEELLATLEDLAAHFKLKMVAKIAQQN